MRSDNPAGKPGPRRRDVPSPLHLAYIGDAVWELHVRRGVVAAGTGKMDDVHRAAVKRVQAEAQAALLHRLMDELSADELHIVRRGRNAKASPPRGVAPRDYRYSTAFECLLGYLYWCGHTERLRTLLRRADERE